MIPVEPSEIADRLSTLCDEADPIQQVTLERILEVVPRLDSLMFEDAGTVLIRVDLDVPLKDTIIVDDSRLRSCVPTIKYCLGLGLQVVLLGHIGRDSRSTIAPIVEPLEALLQTPIEFIPNWFDEDKVKITDNLIKRIGDVSKSPVILLDNARKYSFERSLWHLDEATDEITGRAIAVAEQFASKIAGTEINESIAASNRDVSSSIVPLAMEQTALGFHLDSELRNYGKSVVRADFLIFSGLKADKLVDLRRILQQGYVRELIVGGSLAMALAKAVNPATTIGLAESDPTYIAYMGSESIDLAKLIVDECHERGVILHLPKDFILDDLTVSETVPIGHAQLDIGPTSAKLFSELLISAKSRGRNILFVNGVMGKVEDSQFANGTKQVLQAVASATATGLETYVGGGDGRAALVGFGLEASVTHAFTAGGTILKLMSGRAIPYLLAMYLQHQASPICHSDTTP